jgi:hypothetical protein
MVVTTTTTTSTTTTPKNVESEIDVSENIENSAPQKPTSVAREPFEVGTCLNVRTFFILTKVLFDH